MSKNRKQINKLISMVENDSMKLRRFLILYYGVDIDTNEVKISHQDIKQLLPNLKRVNFDEILKVKELLYTGEVVCVFDSYNNVAFYRKPSEEYKDITCKVHPEKVKEKTNENIILSDKLNKYSLAKLCRKYKKENNMRNYRLVHDMLKSKKQVNKVKQKKLELKVGEEYD